MENLEVANIEDTSHLHPNWRALSSINFRRKVFVRSTEIDENVITKNHETTIEINESASEFYQEVINMIPTSEEKNKKLPIKLPKKKKTPKINFNKELFFKLAINNDAEGIRNHLIHSKDPDINAKDSFEWTALMMAACEGASSSFQVLLDFGANLYFSDRTSNTAVSLAKKNNHQEIIQILESFNCQKEEEEDYIEISDDEDDQKPLFCSDCKTQISIASSNSHQTSTVHLINCKFKGNTDIKSFGIARSNKGYKLMKTLGWDGKSALGSKGNGKLFPIKTVLRKGRSGLGIKQGSARITHFKAHDVRAIKFQSIPRALTKKK